MRRETANASGLLRQGKRDGFGTSKLRASRKKTGENFVNPIFQGESGPPETGMVASVPAPLAITANTFLRGLVCWGEGGVGEFLLPDIAIATCGPKKGRGH